MERINVIISTIYQIIAIDIDCNVSKPKRTASGKAVFLVENRAMKRHKITSIPSVLTYLATTPKPIGLIHKSTLHYMQRLGLVWIYTTPTGIKKAALSHTGLAAYQKMIGKG